MDSILLLRAEDPQAAREALATPAHSGDIGTTTSST